MDFKYRWKNGRPPSLDEAAQRQYLLDEDQFNNDGDREMAEEQARRYLGVPIRIPDEDRSILPHATPPEKKSNI